MDDFVVMIGFFLLTLVVPVLVGSFMGRYRKTSAGIWQNLDWVMLLVATMLFAALYTRPLA